MSLRNIPAAESGFPSAKVGRRKDYRNLPCMRIKTLFEADF
jgi:hypothetical protein